MAEGPGSQVNHRNTKVGGSRQVKCRQHCVPGKTVPTVAASAPWPLGLCTHSCPSLQASPSLPGPMAGRMPGPWQNRHRVRSDYRCFWENLYQANYLDGRGGLTIRLLFRSRGYSPRRVFIVLTWAILAPKGTSMCGDMFGCHS